MRMTKNCAIRRNSNNHGIGRDKSSGCPQGYPQDLCTTFRVRAGGGWGPCAMMSQLVDRRAMTPAARDHRLAMDEDDASCAAVAGGGGRFPHRR